MKVMKRLTMAGALVIWGLTSFGAAASYYYAAASCSSTMSHSSLGTLNFSTLNETSGAYYDANQKENGFTRLAIPTTASTLTAKTKEGYRFAGWYTKSGGWTELAEGSSDPVPATLESATTLLTGSVELSSSVAATSGQRRGIPHVFAKYVKVYDVNVSYSPTNGGTVAKTPTGNPLDEGTTVKLSASASAGYLFARWERKAGSTGVKVSEKSDYSFTLDSSTAGDYTAFFTSKVFTVTFHDTRPSSAVADVKQPVAYGKDATAPSWSRTGYTLNWDKKFDNVTQDLTVNAVWTAVKSTVAFDANGGGTPSKTSITVTYESTYGTLATCSRTGYAFGGWWTAKTGGAKVESSTTVKITSRQTLYAHWTANGYTVRFYPNGGSGSTSDQSFVYDTKQSLMANSFTKTGHTFSHWNTSSDGTGTHYADLQTVSNLTSTAGATVSLYARWEPIRYQVTYKSNGGTGEIANQEFVYDTYGNLASNDFRKVGYSFDGWDTKKDGTGTRYAEGTRLRNLTDVPNSIVTLYAQWTARQITVTFDANGGRTPSPLSKEVSYESTYGTLASCVRTGYTFDGWWTQASGGDEVTMTTKMETETDHTLYAHWTVTVYDIHFEPAGGMGVMSDITSVAYDQVVNLTSNAFTKGIQKFRGWRGSDGRDYADGAAVSNLLESSGVFTNTAIWGEAFFLGFDGNGATNTVMDLQEFEYGTPQTLASNAYLRTGYSFTGWEDRRVVPTVVYTNQAIYVQDRDTSIIGTTNVLVATWSAHSYTVCFSGNGGTNALNRMDSQAFVYDIPQKLHKNTFVRPGCEFLGWALDPTVGEVLLADEEDVSQLTTEDGAVVLLYARWQRKSEGLDNLLSIAADCATNLADRAAINLKGENACTVKTGDDAGGNGQFIRLETESVAVGIGRASAELSGTGTLSFSYKVSIPEPWGDVSYDNSFEVEGIPFESVWTNVEQWTDYTYRKTFSGKETIFWKFVVRYTGKGDYALIDNIRWLPDEQDAGTVGVTFRTEDGGVFSNVSCIARMPIGALPSLTNNLGQSCLWNYQGVVITADWIVPAAQDVELTPSWAAHPEPVEGRDNVTVSLVEVVNGKFELSFKGKADFNYELMTNADLSAGVWAKMEEASGADGTVTFKPLILPEQQRLFYRVRTVQKK